MRQIYLFTVMIANEIQRIFEHSHHAQTKQVHFDDTEVGAIFFVPLHDHAARHGCGFERDDGIELSLANDHAAGVLAEMARQVLDHLAQLEIFSDSWMAEIEAGIAEAVIESVVGVAILPLRHCRRDLAQSFWIEAKHFADFT